MLLLTALYAHCSFVDLHLCGVCNSTHYTVNKVIPLAGHKLSFCEHVVNAFRRVKEHIYTVQLNHLSV